MQRYTRQHTGKAALALLCLMAILSFRPTVAMGQSADGYPNRPIKVVMPFLPGGPTDTTTRLFARKLAEALGQPVVVENRPGANGLLGEDYAAKSKPDGYTLMATSTGYAINPHLYKMPYDARKDFIPVTQFVSAWQILVVNADLPVKNVNDLIALAKSKPARLNAASYGIGSSAHLAMELMSIKAGVKFTHVPYPNFPKALTDLIGGEVQLMFPTLGSALPHVKSGKIRALAVTSPKRLPFLPDIPTMDEAGVPGYEAETWVGLFAPTGTPDAIVSRIQSEVARIVETAEIKSYFEERGDIPVGSTPARFKAFVSAQMEQYADLVKATGMKVE